MNQTFFTQFLQISTWQTILLIVLLLGAFAVIFLLAKRKLSFSARVIVAMVLGVLLGLVMQLMAGFPTSPEEVPYIGEATGWFGLFGNGFMNLIKMLVVPLVLISIIHVIINLENGSSIGKLVRNSLAVIMGMVALAAAVGLALGVLFGVGHGQDAVAGSAEIKTVTPIAQTLTALIPGNPVEAMADMNIIGVVIFSALLGVGARQAHTKKEYRAAVEPFYRGINALHRIVIGVALMIIRLIPYAVIPLLASTLALHGVASIVEVGKFILVLYLAIAVMFAVQLVQLMLFGVSPVAYVKKATRVLALAFTSRSSVGVLPVTIQTLTGKMGVSGGTASFVASFGTTGGMQGCAGVFPALLLVYVANMNGIAVDATFVVMALIVITLGSLGIAGIPGTATMAASVSLSGVGMASLFPSISTILAIDPLIDMGRTLLNVSGSMVNAITVDRTLGLFDRGKYNSSEASQGREDGF